METFALKIITPAACKMYQKNGFKKGYWPLAADAIVTALVIHMNT